MGACIGRRNNIIVKDLKKEKKNKKNNKKIKNNNKKAKKLPSSLKYKKFITSPSLDKLGSHFQGLNKFKNNHHLLHHANNNPNLLDITEVKSDDHSHNDKHNDSTFKEILELFN